MNSSEPTHPFLELITEATRRGVLTGCQCICGQFQPDFVQHGASNEFRTECCGSVYLHQKLACDPNGLTVLSLIEDNFTKREVPKP
jgi:hypothetical protein